MNTNMSIENVWSQSESSETTVENKNCPSRDSVYFRTRRSHFDTMPGLEDSFCTQWHF